MVKEKKKMRGEVEEKVVGGKLGKKEDEVNRRGRERRLEMLEERGRGGKEVKEGEAKEVGQNGQKSGGEGVRGQKR